MLALLALLLVAGVVALALTTGRDVVREQIVYEAIEHDPSRTSEAIRPKLAPRFAELEQRILRTKGFSDEELAELEKELAVQSGDVFEALGAEELPPRVATSIEDALSPSAEDVQNELDRLCREIQATDQGPGGGVVC
ncbi:MAG: hypothetical protein ACR2IN_10940 [Thermoleophilaceae bacterium]|nr:hypothetical protein [Thermoleophilaceae bacterium]